MKKLIIVVFGVVASFLFSGCAAVIQGGASLMAKNASDHPANKTFVVSMPKNDAFNASLRALTNKDRQITSSDREAGIVQGEINKNAVTIKITAQNKKESSIYITVAYAQSFLYGSPKLEEDLNTLVTEISEFSKKDTAITENKEETVSGGTNKPKNIHHKKHTKYIAKKS